MNAYYVIYPRDFANEYTVFVTASPKALETAWPDASRVSREEAIRLGWSRPKEARKHGEQWFGGFFNNGQCADTLDEALDACRESTDRQVDAALDAAILAEASKLAGVSGR